MPTLYRATCRLLLLTLTAVALAPAPSLAAPPELGLPSQPRTLAYASGGKAHLLDLYLPAGSREPVPLIVFIHGGAWRGGSKDNPPVLFLRDRGYAVASINYRLTTDPGHPLYPAPLNDCKAAVRFLRANAAKLNLDPNRFGALGQSAGGHLAALLGVTGDTAAQNGAVSCRVQAVCDYFGPTDLAAFSKFVSPDPKIGRQPGVWTAELLGAAADRVPRAAAQASPTTHAGPDAPPFLILHGTKDGVVPFPQSEALAAALLNQGVSAELFAVPDAGHRLEGAAIERIVLDFFNRNLQPKAVATRTVPEAEQRLRRVAADSSRTLTNGDFRQGLTGWEVERGATGFAVIGRELKGVTTFGSAREQTTGRVYQCFRVPEDASQLRFFLSGGHDYGRAYVALWDGERPWRRLTARNDNTAFEARWDLEPVRGRVLTLEVVDETQGPWGFIAAYGFEVLKAQAAPARTAADRAR